MGLEMSYQALPADSDLLDRARGDGELGEMLSWVPRWFRDQFERGSRPWPEAERLCDELRALAARHPGLEGRNCFLDARWDAMHYLLSAVRRGEPADERDVVLGRAVRGATPVGEHVCGCQGIPIKYVAPTEVARIAGLLKPMSRATLRRHYDGAKMEAAGVYKFAADRAGEWLDLATRFDDFRAFYLAAAEHAEGVIACMD